MRIKLFRDSALVIDGIDKECGAEVEIELVGIVHTAETVRINGRVYHLQNGKRKIPLGAFGEARNDIKILADGTWHVLDGILRRGSRLVLDDGYVAGILADLIIENDHLKTVNKDHQKRVEALEKKCSGDDFL